MVSGRLSLIIPAYNAAPFIDRCLLSVAAQTYHDYEVIVVDDGSTDDTVGKVEKWRVHDNRIVLLQCQHVGVAAARSKALALAQGEMIAFVDADDYLHPQYLELMVGALDGHPEAEMAMTLSVRTAYHHDASMSQTYTNTEMSVRDGMMIRKALFMGYQSITPNQCHTCHGKLFRRALLKGLLFPEEFTVYEDTVMMNNIFRRVNKLVMVHQRLYFWVAHPESKLAAISSKELLQGPRAYLRCLMDIPKNDRETRAACIQRIFLHDVWLRRRWERGGLKTISSEELKSAVNIPLQVTKELLLSPCIPLTGKWHLLLSQYSQRERRQIERRFWTSVPKENSGVGRAPIEQTGLVSVVIPIYNVAEYLPACIDSILAQRYRNLEIILVDDGSTDGSGEICDGYARQDERIVVIHQENMGSASARNSGLDKARGEYVYMPDADDTVHPMMIYLLHKALQQGDFPLAMSEWTATKKVIDCMHMPRLTGETKLQMITQRDIYLSLTDRKSGFVSMCVPWNKLYRRSTISNQRFEKSGSEDSVFHTRMFRHIKHAIIVKQPLYYYLQRSDSRSRSQSAAIQIDRLWSYKQNAEEMRGTEYESWYYDFLYRSMASTIKNSYGQPQYERARQVVRQILRQTVHRMLSVGGTPLKERLRLIYDAVAKMVL
ncbi:MAG: glycosyltransferase [Prevotella sp.]|nr:glycosyltransferase [Prevotella sp.]